MRGNQTRTIYKKSLGGWAFILCFVTLVGVAVADEAQRDEEKLRPYVSGRGGIMAFAKHHNFFVETLWEYPFYARDRFYLSLSHRDTTPFLDTGTVLGTEFQVELLHSTETLRFEYELNRRFALKNLHRYEYSRWGDKPGQVAGYEFGLGFGSPDKYRDSDRLRWEVVAGPVVELKSLDADWFLLAGASWRLWEDKRSSLLANVGQSVLTLDLNLESMNAGGNVNPFLEAGPTLRLPTTGGAQMDLFAHWLQNFDNPFSMLRDRGLLIGFQLDSWHEPKWGHDLLDFKAGRILANSWAHYQAGAGAHRFVTMLETKMDVLEFSIGPAPLTATIWYQHRQEFRHDDYEHTNYTVVTGLNTPVTIPLVSRFLARDEPAVFAVDFLHRSDHALDPPAERFGPLNSRVTPYGRYLQHSNVNIWRTRLQSLGWEEPYRYPSHFENETRWLGVVDWRVTMGWVEQYSRRRGNPTGQPAVQIAANVDIASLAGFVLYAQGAYSIKQETPDYYAEIGIKRPTFRVFGRWEDYATTPVFSKGGGFYFGVGINL